MVTKGDRTEHPWRAKKGRQETPAHAYWRQFVGKGRGKRCQKEPKPLKKTVQSTANGEKIKKRKKQDYKDTKSPGMNHPRLIVCQLIDLRKKRKLYITILGWIRGRKTRVAAVIRKGAWEKRLFQPKGKVTRKKKQHK